MNNLSLLSHYCCISDHSTFACCLFILLISRAYRLICIWCVILKECCLLVVFLQCKYIVALLSYVGGPTIVVFSTDALLFQERYSYDCLTILLLFTFRKINIFFNKSSWGDNSKIVPKWTRFRLDIDIKKEHKANLRQF